MCAVNSDGCHNNGFLVVIVLFILLAIIFGSTWF